VFERQKSNMLLTITISSPNLWFAIPLTIVLLICLALMIALYKFYLKNELFKKLTQELNLSRLSLHNTYFKHQLLDHYLRHIQWALASQNYAQSNDLLIQLSKVIRNVIKRTENNPTTLSVVSLEEEINFIENYLKFLSLQNSSPIQIQQRRKGDFKLGTQLVPFLFFQPMLEIAQQLQNQGKEGMNPLVIEFDILDKGEELEFQIRFNDFTCELKEDKVSFESPKEAMDRIQLLNDLGISCGMNIENHYHFPIHCFLGLTLKKDWKIPYAASH
jgi:hypothetical protein